MNRNAGTAAACRLYFPAVAYQVSAATADRAYRSPAGAPTRTSLANVGLIVLGG